MTGGGGVGGERNQATYDGEENDKINLLLLVAKNIINIH